MKGESPPRLLRSAKQASRPLLLSLQQGEILEKLFSNESYKSLFSGEFTEFL